MSMHWWEKTGFEKKYNVKNASFQGASALKSGINSCHYAKDYKFIDMLGS